MHKEIPLATTWKTNYKGSVTFFSVDLVNNFLCLQLLVQSTVINKRYAHEQPIF
jgi:hypothetical protein